MSLAGVRAALGYLRATIAHNGEIAILCPKCEERTGKPDRKRKLYLNPAKNAAFCFRCEYRTADLARFADTLFPAEVAEIVRAACNPSSFGASAEEMLGGAVSADGRDRSPLDLPSRSADVYGDDPETVGERAAVEEALRGRGLTPDEIRAFGLRVALGADVPTVTIPVTDAAGRIVFYYCRRFGPPDDPRRYVYPSEDHTVAIGGFTLPALPGRAIGDFLVGLGWNRFNRRRVFIVEGFFDLAGVSRLGEWAVALGGKRATREKARAIAGLDVDRIVLLLDSDVDAEEIANLGADIEAESPKARVEAIRIPGGDPGDWLKRAPTVSLSRAEPLLGLRGRMGL